METPAVCILVYTTIISYCMLQFFSDKTLIFNLSEAQTLVNWLEKKNSKTDRQDGRGQ